MDILRVFSKKNARDIKDHYVDFDIDLSFHYVAASITLRKTKTEKIPSGFVDAAKK